MCTSVLPSSNTGMVHHQGALQAFLDLCCRPDLFAVPLSRVASIEAAAYNLLGLREPWAAAAVGNSSFMFAESGQFVLNRYLPKADQP